MATGDQGDLTRRTSLAQRPALRIETVDAGRIGREPHLVALLEAELANCPRGYPGCLRHVDVEERVAAEVLGGGDGAAPALPVTARHDMLRTNPNRGRIHPGGKLTRHEVHARRADEPRDEEVVGPRVELKRRAHLFNPTA